MRLGRDLCVAVMVLGLALRACKKLKGESEEGYHHEHPIAQGELSVLLRKKASNDDYDSNRPNLVEHGGRRTVNELE